jgi:PRC-barrel domain
MATMQSTTDVQTRETGDLIASDKVEGTTVYGQKGERAGSIKRVMIGKRDGKVAFAVMSFGGVLGIGEDYYPLPWSALTYNERLGGYEVPNLTPQKLKGAPSFGSSEEWNWSDRNRTRNVMDYWGPAP